MKIRVLRVNDKNSSVPRVQLIQFGVFLFYFVLFGLVWSRFVVIRFDFLFVRF